MIYIASPYSVGECDSDLELEIMDKRALSAKALAAELAQERECCYSPIAAWHDTARLFSLPKEADFWMDMNGQWLDACDKLCALKLPGWKDSTGMHFEMQYARETDIPIEFAKPDPLRKERQEQLLEKWKNSQ